MVAVIALTSWFSGTMEPSIEGNIKYYNPGVMEQVAVNRGYIDNASLYRGWLEERGLSGAISLMRYGDIGRTAWLVVPEFAPVKVLVIDCVEKKHYLRRVVKQGDIAEVDWTLAQLFNMKQPIRGRIRFVSKPQRRAR